jgi:hypothetical protein
MTPKAIKKLLESDFWLQTLSTEESYMRVQDDHDGTFEGRVSVNFDHQGDAWLCTDQVG